MLINSLNTCRFTFKSTNINSLNQQPDIALSRQAVSTEARRTKSYIMTNRGKETLGCFYPKEAFADIQGKRVLDIGCGGGKAVLELREKGVNAIGIDVGDPSNALESNELTSDKYLTSEHKKNGIFVKTPAHQTPFPDNSFDRALSSLAVFFEDYEQPDYQKQALAETKRVLKPGGELYTFGRNAQMEQIAEQVGGLEVTRLSNERFKIKKL